MIVLQILIAVIAAIGLGFILSDAFRIPKFPVSKAITTLGKRQKKLDLKYIQQLKQLKRQISL